MGDVTLLKTWIQGFVTQNFSLQSHALILIMAFAVSNDMLRYFLAHTVRLYANPSLPMYAQLY